MVSASWPSCIMKKNRTKQRDTKFEVNSEMRVGLKRSLNKDQG